MRRSTICLLAALLALAATTLGACGGTDVQTPTGAIDIARDQAARSEIMLVKTGIAAYAALNGVAPPDASPATLGSFVAPWPKNPWTQAPMKQGKTEGDIVYAPGAGTQYAVGVVLSDGSVYNAP